MKGATPSEVAPHGEPPGGRRPEAELWQRVREHGDASARQRLVQAYQGLVYHTVEKLVRRGARSLTRDELVSAGLYGLVQAIKSFDPKQGTRFSSFAMPRIRGAMQDELRASDWLPRGVRAKKRLLRKARMRLELRLARAPAAEEMADDLGIDLVTYWRWEQQLEDRKMIPLDHPGDSDGAWLAETLTDPRAAEPIESLVAAENLEAVRAGFARLGETDRTVLTLYYYERLPQRQIGEVLRVSESRVSQIRLRALERLRRQAGFEASHPAPAPRRLAA